MSRLLAKLGSSPPDGDDGDKGNRQRGADLSEYLDSNAPSSGLFSKLARRGNDDNNNNRSPLKSVVAVVAPAVIEYPITEEDRITVLTPFGVGMKLPNSSSNIKLNWGATAHIGDTRMISEKIDLEVMLFSEPWEKAPLKLTEVPIYERVAHLKKRIAELLKLDDLTGRDLHLSVKGSRLEDAKRVFDYFANSAKVLPAEVERKEAFAVEGCVPVLCIVDEKPLDEVKRLLMIFVDNLGDEATSKFRPGKSRRVQWEEKFRATVEFRDLRRLIEALESCIPFSSVNHTWELLRREWNHNVRRAYDLADLAVWLWFLVRNVRPELFKKVWHEDGLYKDWVKRILKICVRGRSGIIALVRFVVLGLDENLQRDMFPEYGANPSEYASDLPAILRMQDVGSYDVPEDEITDIADCCLYYLSKLDSTRFTSQLEVSPEHAVLNSLGEISDFICTVMSVIPAQCFLENWKYEEANIKLVLERIKAHETVSNSPRKTKSSRSAPSKRGGRGGGKLGSLMRSDSSSESNPFEKFGSPPKEKSDKPEGREGPRNPPFGGGIRGYGGYSAYGYGFGAPSFGGPPPSRAPDLARFGAPPNRPAPAAPPPKPAELSIGSPNELPVPVPAPNNDGAPAGGGPRSPSASLLESMMELMAYADAVGDPAAAELEAAMSRILMESGGMPPGGDNPYEEEM
eukprot:TRINITY_DN42437_c0_g1_i4.p1 TRINITY_DN42437_c0_g1~~TRINITY_DN42437_c0_g1_i4.p1  ORF type:complete len:685 (-),score=158.13 TRINITY_DN42437_c0_g1_i4:199-2253(-)